MYFPCGFTCAYVFNENNSMISGEKTVVLKGEFVSDLVINIYYFLKLKYTISFWVFQMILKYIHTYTESMFYVKQIIYTFLNINLRKEYIM